MRTLLLLFLLLFTLGITAQNLNNSDSSFDHVFSSEELMKLHNVKEFPLTNEMTSRSVSDLPFQIDNSNSNYFRSVFSQVGWSCNQAGSIGYNFTYEMCRLRELSADFPENQYPTHFCFNLLNDGEYNRGVSYIDTWEVLKSLGTPNVEDYGGMSPYGYLYWPTGYDFYYKAMQNRIDDYFKITVRDEEGLLLLKNWLYDHMNNEQPGGLANIMIGSYMPEIDKLAEGTPEEGKFIVTAWYPDVGHNVTIVGWNDSIRYDFNQDGLYTNHIDINDDGIIDMKDWEIGGLKFVNSHGDSWCDGGYAYMMYRLAAMQPEEGGIFDNAFYVASSKVQVDPILTFKAKVSHTSRGKLNIMAGVSTDTATQYPEHILRFPFFNFHGGDYPMQGDTTEEAKTLEFGLDVSPLLSYIDPNDIARFFLVIEEKDPENYSTGEIISFSLMDYTMGGTEIPCTLSNVPIEENGLSMLSIDHAVDYDKLDIVEEEIPPIIPGEYYSYQLNSLGGIEPYTWEDHMNYYLGEDHVTFPQTSANLLTLSNNQDGYGTIHLDFPFPFYGKTYDSVLVFADGYILFEEGEFHWPYLILHEFLLKIRNAIVPMAADFVINPSQGDGIWYEMNPGQLLIRWNVSLMGDPYESDLNFAIRIIESGDIEFLYGTLESGSPASFLTGIGSGDGINYKHSGLSTLHGISDGDRITFAPSAFPAGLEITRDGLIFGTIEEGNAEYELTVAVMDNNNNIANRSFPISSRDISIQHSILSGGDDFIEYGETVLISSTIENNSDQTLENLVLELELDNPFAEVLDDFENIGTLAPGESVELSEVLSLKLSTEIPDQYPLILLLKYNASNDTIIYKDISMVNAPEIRITQLEVLDEYGIIEPGEETQLKLSLSNLGHVDLPDVNTQVIVEDNLISVEEPNVSYGDIGVSQEKTAYFTLIPHEFAPQGVDVMLRLAVSGDDGMVRDTIPFILTIGKTQVFIADLDPLNHSGPSMDSLLYQMSVTHEYDNVFPYDPQKYHSIFVCLGTYFTNYELQEWQGEKLAQFLSNGGNLYMEGRETWLDDPQTSVHDLFGVNTTSSSWFTMDTLSGSPETWFESMEFKFLAQNNYSDYLFAPSGTSYSVFDAGNDDKSCIVANETGEYKTIASSVQFGKLWGLNDSSSREILMKKYLEFFGVKRNTYSIGESFAGGPEISVFPNPATNWISVNIKNPVDSQGEILVYNVLGELMIIDEYEIEARGGVFNLNLSGLQEGLYFLRIINGNSTVVIKIIIT